MTCLGPVPSTTIGTRNPRTGETAHHLPSGVTGWWGYLLVAVRGDAVDDGVDDLLDETVGERCVAVQQSVVDGPVEQVEGDVDVRVRGDLAAVDGPTQEFAGIGPARLDEVFPVELGEFGVGLGLGDEAGDDPPVWPLFELPQPGAE